MFINNILVVNWLHWFRGPCSNNSGGSRGGAQEARYPSPPYFYAKLRPEGPKKIFLATGPHLISKGQDDRPHPPYLIHVWTNDALSKACTSFGKKY